MVELGDLVRDFLSRLPDAVIEGTNLWLAYEEGKASDLRALKRLLHTIKGEAHMLGLESCGGLAQALEEVVIRAQDADVRVPEAGDAFLEGLDALMLFSAAESGEPVDVAPLIGALNEVAEAIPAPAAEPADAKTEGEEADRSVPPTTPSASAPPTDEASSSAPREAHGEPESSAAVRLRVEDVQPAVHELRRLLGEQDLLLPRMREVQRILRAIVAEMDPTLPPAVLGEQVIKTLGYASEVERQLATISAEWASNSFATSLALDGLAETTRKAAVVSVSKIRSQLERAARTTARSLHKEVELRIEGDAYIDASVARRLESALLHAVRNSVDHGIELPEERERRGKPRRGRIHVQIEQHVSTVRVAVQDDGGGVDLDALRAKLGIGPAVPDEEVLGHLFDSGFSTREETTEVSGRGVGLDVVARETEAVGGSVNVENEPGKGFRLVIVVPTILRADLVVPIDFKAARLALPARNVEAFVRLTELEATTDGLRLRFTGRGEAELLPVYTLGPILGETIAPTADARAAILHYEGMRFALMIDDYGAPRTLPFQPSADLPARSPVVQGIAPTPDGGVRMLVDVRAMVETLSGVAVGPVETEKARKHRVLVVEDAPVARELLCGILRSFGLHVREAAHGREGLDRMKTQRPDLVLTDVEMPFIGGLEMIEEMKKDPQLTEIPVIVLTTDTREHTQRRARALGVHGFLSKQRFVEDELRELIDRALSG